MNTYTHTQGELATDGLLLYIKGQNIGQSKLGQVYTKETGLNNDGSQKEDTERLANAERLVLCWNTHDKLVAVVKEYMDYLESMWDFSDQRSDTNERHYKCAQLLNQLNTKP